MKMKLYAELIFTWKGFALKLALKQRHERTRKWPIEFQSQLYNKRRPAEEK